MATLSFSLLSDANPPHHLKAFKLLLYKNATSKPQYHIHHKLSFTFRFLHSTHLALLHKDQLAMDRVTNMVSERPVVIFSKSSCCMSHSIKTLFCDFGVNPSVHELDEIPRGRDIEQALSRLGCSPSVPAVFIAGELVGGANEVMTLHLNRSLIPMLKKAGALWV